MCKTAEDILHGYLLGDSYIAFCSVGNMLTSTLVSLISCDRLLSQLSVRYMGESRNRTPFTSLP